MADLLLESSTKAGGDTVTASNNNDQRLDDLQQAGEYRDSSGSANAYVVADDAQIASLKEGQLVTMNANFTNTGSATLNFGGFGAKTIKKWNDQNLEAGDIETGQVVVFRYDGTDMQMLTPTAVQISSANKATLTDGSNAEALHVHPKAFTDEDNVGTISATGNTDLTFTPGFEAGVIEVYIGQLILDGDTADRYLPFGKLVFDGTTFKFRQVSSYLSSSTDTQNYQFITALGTTNAAFASTGSNMWSVVISVQSVSSTQFVVRVAATKTNSPANIAAFDVGVIAHPA